MAMLRSWLTKRPSADLLDAWCHYSKSLSASLNGETRKVLQKEVLNLVETVARSAGGVLGFGSISGRLDGRIAGLRLVDWTPVAFNARFTTDAKPKVEQRISRRAVQNISSVGDASFVTSLQGQLIGLFDDFGYRRIGIACRLANEVCAMSGLQDSDDSQAGNSFTIVQGAGIPRLDVVGFNRLVDWPTLVERLTAVASGEVKPVVD